MSIEQDLTKLKEDLDVINPFINRLMQRIHERFPNEDIRLQDVAIKIEITKPNPIAQIYRLLDDISKEGISL